MSILRSQTGNRIIVIHRIHQINDTPIATSSTAWQRDATITVSLINEDTIKYQRLRQKSERDVKFIFNGPEDPAEAEFKHMVFDNHLYQNIEVSNQLYEMLTGSDETAILMAYDLISQHAQQLSGSILLK